MIEKHRTKTSSYTVIVIFMDDDYIQASSHSPIQQQVYPTSCEINPTEAKERSNCKCC